MCTVGCLMKKCIRCKCDSKRVKFSSLKCIKNSSSSLVYDATRQFHAWATTKHVKNIRTESGDWLTRHHSRKSTCIKINISLCNFFFFYARGSFFEVRIGSMCERSTTLNSEHINIIHSFTFTSMAETSERFVWRQKCLNVFRSRFTYDSNMNFPPPVPKQKRGDYWACSFLFRINRPLICCS